MVFYTVNQVGNVRILIWENIKMCKLTVLHMRNLKFWPISLSM
jgi:hypothetical protein